MAITSPDGLISPDAGDPYNLTSDWAASMSSVQAALIDRANQIGTTTQRNSWSAKEGDLWWDTTLSQAFIFDGSSWVAITSSDTGPVDLSGYLTGASNVSYATGSVINGIAFVDIRAEWELPSGNSFVSITSGLPSEFTSATARVVAGTVATDLGDEDMILAARMSVSSGSISVGLSRNSTVTERLTMSISYRV